MRIRRLTGVVVITIDRKDIPPWIFPSGASLEFNQQGSICTQVKEDAFIKAMQEFLRKEERDAKKGRKERR